jgi:hypothetical protein
MAWRARTNRTEFKSEDLSICGHIGIFFSGHRPGANCLRSVKRLPELETECFHQLQSLAAQNSGRSFFKRHCHERCSTGMHAKTNRSLFHDVLFFFAGAICVWPLNL